ncbi:hypothetical protein [Salinimicrobium sp. HB62]|uniref:hypothetical protein n=1 Tax=Salinimicrobium sp. HB62 TaxID=3077781 RepID=UPI002D7867EE|nr:hypothetical protein [Salinimicrobium sp. HB62]
MKIPYKKRQLNFNLYFGSIWLIFFLGQFFFDDEFNWIDYGLLVSIAYFGTYYYKVKYKYVTIDEGNLTVNGPFGKSVALDEIVQIKSFAGEYILKTEKQELRINTHTIKPESLAILNKELKKLQVVWNYKPSTIR